MHADFSVELGRDDAALELPWSSADPAVRYYDLKNNPELLQQIPEAMAYPELGAFLARINAAGFPLATAKCDAWLSREVTPEEEIYGDRKFVSYIDLVFEGEVERCSFERHEAFAKDLCRLLSQAPEIPAAVEVVIRRCYYHGERALPEAGAVVGNGDEVAKEFKTEVGTEARDDAAGAGEAADAGEAAGAREVADAGDRVGTGGAEVSEAEDARHRVETRGATEVDDATEVGDVEERQSGAANREGADRVVASERTEQQADVGHGMRYEGNADAGQRAKADIEKGEATERLDVMVADEGVGPSGLDGSVSGFCFTAYATGFGDKDHEPRLRWQIALALLQNALVQLARA
ncbi:MAG TPA: hypothetical protein VHW72_05530 [Candidatus Angelobacter sp.]|jgi:hypothetical protein|nr:hypothetical protein [Candidatus Angelobacter sp.]